MKAKITLIFFSSLFFLNNEIKANTLLSKINYLVIIEDIINSYKEIEILKNINPNYISKSNCKSKFYLNLTEKKLKIKILINQSERCNIEILDKTNYTIELNIKLAENLKLCKNIKNDFTSTGSIDYKFINPNVKLPANIIPIRDFIYIGFIIEQDIISLSKTFDSSPIETRFLIQKSISNPPLSNPPPNSLFSTFPSLINRNSYLGIYFLTTPIDEKYLSASVFFLRRFVLKTASEKCFQKVEWQVKH